MCRRAISKAVLSAMQKTQEITTFIDVYSEFNQIIRNIALKEKVFAKNEMLVIRSLGP